MSLKFRRLDDESTKSGGTMRMPDRTLVVINIVLILYCGNADEEKSFQTVNDQNYIQVYLYIYLHNPHSASMIKLFLHFIRPLGIKLRMPHVETTSVHLSVHLWPNTLG